jgi:hypothetical protein
VSNETAKRNLRGMQKIEEKGPWMLLDAPTLRTAGKMLVYRGLASGIRDVILANEMRKH